MKKRRLFYSLIAATLFVFFYFCNRFIETMRCCLSEGGNLITAMNGIWGAIKNRPLHMSVNMVDMVGAGLCVMILLMLAGLKSGRKFRVGEEHGSARWGTAQDIAPFINPEADKNIILTKTEMLSMENLRGFEYDRNKNVLIYGGSGSGKTFSVCKPNLLQCYGSYVFTDPKGTVMADCGAALKQNGYVIKSLNLNGAQGLRLSQHYNPFAYIKSEVDILKFVETFMANTTGEGEHKGESFWIKAERMYYCALIGYIWSEGEPEEKNMRTLLELHNHSKAKQNDEDYKCPIDLMFEELEAEKPTSFAVRQYKKFKQGAGETAQSILISCGARLAPFDIEEVLELMDYDELELDKLGDRKTAFFVITSDTDQTFNFVAAIMYSQMFNLLCDRALYDYSGLLPIPVRCILDEFANIGKIPDFEKLIAVIRSRNISATIILQSKAQLESVYKDKTDIIIGNCDTMLFLGGQGVKNLEEIVKILGKETISERDESTSRGSQKSDGSSVKNLGRELMTVDELSLLPRGKCICKVDGLPPFKSDKFDLRQHPRYSLTADADPKNTYIPDWVKLAEPPAPEESFIFCEHKPQDAA